MVLRSAVGLVVVSALMACPASPPGADAGTGGGAGGGGGGAADAGLSIPTGPSVAVALPSGAGTGDFGNDVSMALDANDHPMLSYSWSRPGGDVAQGGVYFVRWDPGTGAWGTPVKVDTVGPVFSNAPLRHTAVAFDASTGVIAVAYGRFNTRTPPRNELVYSTHLALSTDGGRTFTTELVSERQDMTSGSEEAYLPALKLAGGRTHLAYFQRWQRCTSGSGSDCHAAWYVTRTGNTGAFTRTLAPLTTGTAGNRALPLSLALDSQGNPGLAYFLGETAGNNTTLAFWRPGSATAVAVFDSAGVQNDAPALSLAFAGVAPRVVAALDAVANPTADLRFSSSADGVTWTAPVLVPRDGGQNVSSYVALSIAGGATALAAYNGGGSSAGTCGAPKLSRSADLTTWTTCGVDKATLDSGAGRYVNLAHTAAGKLVMAFHYPVTTNAAVPAGVVVWREP